MYVPVTYSTYEYEYFKTINYENRFDCINV